MGSSLPDDLTEVTPAVEVVHARGGGTVGSRVVLDLVVVHQVGNHHADFLGLDAVSNVLTVATAIDVTARDVSMTVGI